MHVDSIYLPELNTGIRMKKISRVQPRTSVISSTLNIFASNIPFGKVIKYVNT